MSDVWLRPGKSVNAVQNIMLKKMVEENEELTTKSLPASTLQIWPCPTHCESEIPPCQLQTSSSGDLLASKALTILARAGRRPRKVS